MLLPGVTRTSEQATSAVDRRAMHAQGVLALTVKERGGHQVEHNPDRPSWRCGVCGLSWPCEPAREQLVRGRSRLDLAVLMWEHLEEAARDMPQAPASYLFDRFLRWTS
ncbi:hypothetical protein GCM10009828_023240 [Actinoplanes couchii]|uniref:Flavin reductase n=2 Tax=Actinoplanes couchii TaxID=403638 RepID=A0ABQ3X4S6_9ACTN|nr:hypothetical protein Aco03nite_019290 [Actinoplanes couchii]